MFSQVSAILFIIGFMATRLLFILVTARSVRILLECFLVRGYHSFLWVTDTPPLDIWRSLPSCKAKVDSSDFPLVQHLLVSSWPALQLSLFDPRTYTHTSMGMTQNQDWVCSTVCALTCKSFRLFSSSYFWDNIHKIFVTGRTLTLIHLFTPASQQVKGIP